MIRGGKKRIILKCPKGQKLGKTKKSCVRMSSKEKAHRSKGARKAAKKSSKNRAVTNRKRAKSMRRRAAIVRKK